MLIKKAAIYLGIYLMMTSPIRAQLSMNPWEEPNDEDTVAAIYEEQQRFLLNEAEEYEPEETTVIDRSYAYIEVPIEENEDGDGDEDGGSSIWSAMRGIFAPRAKETQLLLNTQENRQKLAEAEHYQESMARDSDETLYSKIGLDKLDISLPRIKIPRWDASQMIQRIRRATRAKLKGLSRKLR